MLDTSPNRPSRNWLATGLVALLVTAAALGIGYFGFVKPAHEKQVAAINQLNSQVKDLSETKTKLEATKVELTTKVEQKTAEVVDTGNKLTEIKTRVNGLESELATLSTAKAKSEDEKVALESRLADVNKQLKQARTDLAAAGENNKGLKSEVAELNTRLDIAETKVVAMTKQIEVAMENLKAEQAARATAEQQAREIEAQRVTLAAQKAEMQQMYKELTPTRLEQRRETATGQKYAQKRGIPLGSIFDGIGDAVVGTGESMKSNRPIYWVAVMPDKTEVRITDDIARQWMAKGVPGQPIVQAEPKQTQSFDIPNGG
jgi:septal ring factor EnvC (AmiA/AmiB activator)